MKKKSLTTAAALELNKARWDKKEWRSKKKRSQFAREMANAFWDKQTPEQRRKIGARLKKARAAKKK